MSPPLVFYTAIGLLALLLGGLALAAHRAEGD